MQDADDDIGRSYQRHFNPYLNFHRERGQPWIVDERGKEKYVYRRYARPCETLRELALPKASSYLKPELRRSQKSRALTDICFCLLL